jgi:hypothetical protein
MKGRSASAPNQNEEAPTREKWLRLLPRRDDAFRSAGQLMGEDCNRRIAALQQFVAVTLRSLRTG